MNKNWRNITYTIGLTASLLSASSVCFAQIGAYPSINNRITHAKQVLAELDDKALTCMSSFNLNLGEAAALLCDEFMRAIDGELLASYLEDCSAANTWRDALVAQNLEANTALQTGAARGLKLAIETYCDKGALQQQTTYVTTAFNTLVKGTLLNQAVTQSFELRLSELEQQIFIDREKRALQRAIETQRLQREQATQNQFRDIENELIRQQINN
jgi:hypothetical protein